MFGTGRESPSAAGLLEREAADVRVESVLDLFELPGDLLTLLAESLCEGLERHRLVAHKENRFQGCAELVHRWS